MSIEKLNAVQNVLDSEKEYQKKLLDIVFEVSGDNEALIDAGIIRALRGVKEKARRTYLWNVLSRAAAARIRRARRKFPITA